MGGDMEEVLSKAASLASECSDCTQQHIQNQKRFLCRVWLWVLASTQYVFFREQRTLSAPALLLREELTLRGSTAADRLKLAVGGEHQFRSLSISRAFLWQLTW